MFTMELIGTGAKNLTGGVPPVRKKTTFLGQKTTYMDMEIVYIGMVIFSMDFCVQKFLM